MAEKRCADCDSTFVALHCDVCGAPFCPHCWMVSGFINRVARVCRCMHAEYYSPEAVEAAGRLVQPNGWPCPISWMRDGLEQRSMADIVEERGLCVGLVNVQLELDANCKVGLRCAPAEFVKYVQALEGALEELRQ